MTFKVCDEDTFGSGSPIGQVQGVDVVLPLTDTCPPKSLCPWPMLVLTRRLSAQVMVDLNPLLHTDPVDQV